MALESYSFVYVLRNKIFFNSTAVKEQPEPTTGTSTGSWEEGECVYHT